MDVDDREPAREWTDEHTGEHVPDHQRLTEALREEPAGECGKQHEREIGDKGHSVAAYTEAEVRAAEELRHCAIENSGRAGPFTTVCDTAVWRRVGNRRERSEEVHKE